MGRLAEAAEELISGAECGIQTLAAQLASKGDIELLDDVRDLLTPGVTTPSAAAVSRALTDEGYRVAADTIQKHRRGECVRCTKRPF